MKPYTFIFFGIVGSGKGTQAELLQKYLKEKNLSDDVLCTSVGAEYRKIIESGSYTSTIIKDILEKGYLQPDFLTISLFTNILTTNLKENTSLIADGFPRTIPQSEAFEKAMKFYNRGDVKVIYIELSKEEAVRRMKLRGRTDDTDEGIANRFDEYVKNVIPSMNYFKGKDGYTIYTINGEQSIPDVYKELISKLGI
ncbi:MAG TPA: nucleoside monophosphate kinase [Candidatus Paceibacterota bacterium]|nr:nucleoside monophosphate kinase [Candidatus Paceibacterota bacterium]